MPLTPRSRARSPHPSPPAPLPADGSSLCPLGPPRIPPRTTRDPSKSPARLTKTAARAVVKAVRNSVFPPKDNPFDALDGSDPAADPAAGAAAPCPRSRSRSRSRPPPPPTEARTGQVFLNLVRAESARLSALADGVEAELASDQFIPEEIQEKLRTVSGQARLLVKKKLQQFDGLCSKNVNQERSEGFPITVQDLAGFWDMVKLQIDQVDRRFAEIDGLRRTAWAFGGDAVEPEERMHARSFCQPEEHTTSRKDRWEQMEPAEDRLKIEVPGSAAGAVPALKTSSRSDRPADGGSTTSAASKRPAQDKDKGERRRKGESPRPGADSRKPPMRF